ncbi:methyltransferase [Spirosoma sp. BT702]|uniref:Methyltransferase n=1 Tax=Spirosoma profusum TaxID=2771354 RepID=A0A927AVX7_9BACT|nr:methyltransferase [Spirosoma profusum]MBD2705361.1 methyltransferase [Spirosoma profusum]
MTIEQLPPAAILMQMLFGYAVSRSIGVAAELHIADLVKDNPKTADELAAQTGSHPHSLYRLLRACASVGVFAEDADHRFGLTPLADCLRSDNPESLRAFAEMLTNDTQFQMWADLSYSVKTGERAFDKVFGMPVFDYYSSHEKAGRLFNEAMTSLSLGASMAVLAGYDFSGINKLVDVGGGQGFLLASILKKYPHMRGMLFDPGAIVAEASDLLEAQGVTDRCEMIEGDFFQAVPEGGDAYLMKHIIHDWNDEQCLTILRNCRRSIVENGKLLVVEMVIPDGNEPSMSKLLDLQMLAILPGKERTANEYRALFQQSGFKLTQIVPTMSPYSIIEGVAV